MTIAPSMNLTAELDRRYPGQDRIPISKLTSDIRHGGTIPSGTFVVMASGDRKLRARILEKDTPHKGFSVPLPLNALANDVKITPRYMLWFFSQQFVGEYLMERATGAVFLRVPKSVIYDLPVPIPRAVTRQMNKKELVLKRKNDDFGSHLERFYNDYVFNIRSERYHTAVILAGALAEMIIFQSLIDQGVDRKLLEEDRNLGLGKMLTYLKLLKLEKDVPFSHLKELQKKRNGAVHVGAFARQRITFAKNDLVCFDHIIRHYGI